MGATAAFQRGSVFAVVAPMGRSYKGVRGLRQLTSGRR